MSSVYKQTYTKHIPAGATIVTRKDKDSGREVSFARFKRKGRQVELPLNKEGTRIVLETSKWYAEWTLPGGEVKRCAGYKDREATVQLAAKKEREAARGEEGLTDEFQKELSRPIGEHLEDYRRALESKGDCMEHVKGTIARLEKLFAGINCRNLATLKPEAVANWLAQLRSGSEAALQLDRDWYTVKEMAALLGMKPETLSSFLNRNQLIATGKARKDVPEAGDGDGRERLYPRSTVEIVQTRGRQAGSGVSPQTTNQYLSHLKSFCHWLTKPGIRRMRSNPIKDADLRPVNEEVDRRHDRRELTADELRTVLDTAKNSATTFRGLTGADRFHLYATACGTGFRASALASLTPESFDLDAGSPTVTLAARNAKNRKTKVQPIPADVADLLREYLKGKPAGQRVWGGTWASDRRGAEMLRRDLDAAGVPYVVEGPDGPLFADFHALRHTYLTLLGRGAWTCGRRRNWPAIHRRCSRPATRTAACMTSRAPSRSCRISCRARRTSRPTRCVWPRPARTDGRKSLRASLRANPPQALPSCRFAPPPRRETL